MPWYAPLVKALRAALYLAEHVFVAAVLIGAIYLIQWLLATSGDPKLYDWIPIRYIFDTMEAGILLVFLVLGSKMLSKRFRRMKEMAMALRGFPSLRYPLKLLIVYSVAACGVGLLFVLGISLVARPVLSLSFLSGVITGILTSTAIGRHPLTALIHWWSSISRSSHHQSA